MRTTAPAPAPARRKPARIPGVESAAFALALALVGAMAPAAPQAERLGDDFLTGAALTGAVLVAPEAPAATLAAWDLIVIFSSGGKDSQTALRRALQRARRDGVLHRVIVVHNDLGRVEWQGTRELAEIQARRYGVPFVAVTKAGPDLLDQIEARGMFPDRANRWCTSGNKREPGRVQLTALVKALAAPKREGRPARVLQVFGFRAEESPARAGKEPFAFNAGTSTQGTRHVFDWLPIHEMTAAQVWADIRLSGVPYHPVYRWMSRLSCSFCVLASKADLLAAVRLRPDLAAEYVRVEAAKGHAFQNGRTLASIVAEAATLPALTPFSAQWMTCGVCGVDVLGVAGETSARCPAHEPLASWGAAVAAADAAAAQGAAQGADCGALSLF